MFSWPDSTPPGARINLWVAAAPGEGQRWLSAFFIGPGFFVFQDGSRVFHRWIEALPWRVAGMDSVLVAAGSADVVGDEAYFLFGGVRGGQGGTTWARLIDVYGLDGGYRRSYALPVGAVHLTTDGARFFVLAPGPAPALLVLRPKTRS
jgi:hypothetical protein